MKSLLVLSMSYPSFRFAVLASVPPAEKEIAQGKRDLKVTQMSR